MLPETTKQAIDALWKSIDDDWEGTSMQLTALEDLDEKLKELEELQTNIANGMTTRTIRMRQLRNESTPFHRLPVELFHDILLWSIDIANWDMKQLHNLAMVSKHWKDTVLTSPMCWPSISLRQADSINQAVLKRNRSATLAVWCNGEGYSSDTIQTFLKLCQDTSERWRALSYVGETSEAVMKHLTSPAPNLQDLFLRQHPEPASHKMFLDLPEGVHLRHLSLEGVSLPWDSSRLTRLESLNITDLSWNLPTPTQLYRILATSPNLKRLVIWKLFPEDPSAVPSEDVFGVHNGPLILPHLSTLILSAMPKPWVRNLLSRLTAKSCKCIIMDHAHVSHLGDEAFKDLITPSIKASPGLELKFSTTHQGIYIISNPKPNMSREWYHWANDEPGINIFLSMWGCQREAWSALSQLTRLNPATEGFLLRVSGDDQGDNPSLFPTEAFKDFPNVRSLEMKLPYDELLYNLRYLSNPYTDGTGLRNWPLPNLTNITIKIHGLHGRRAVVSEAIIKLIKQRHTPGAEGPPLAVEAPKPLQKIIIDSAILSELPEGPAFESVHLSTP